MLRNPVEMQLKKRERETVFLNNMLKMSYYKPVDFFCWGFLIFYGNFRYWVFASQNITKIFKQV